MGLVVEVVSGDAVVGLARLENGLLPLRMVHAVRVVLGLQGHAAVLGVVDTVFAHDVQEIAGVKLDAKVT